MKKCTDRKGVTILMALLLLLVASMVSVVILTAATTAARHISNDRQSQQTYLTVSSAAELFRDAIQSGSGGYQEIVTKTYSGTQLQGTKTEKQNASGPFSEIFNNVIPTLLTSPTTFRKTYTLSMTGLEDVTMELTIQPKQEDNTQFTLTAVFYNDTEGKHPCQMTVGFGGTTNVKYTDWGDDYTGNHYYATTTEIKWTGATITRPRTQTGG